MIGSYVPFNYFSYFRVGPTRGSSRIWGSNFSNADYKRTVRDISDLFFGNDRFMYPLSPFHNFGWVRYVVPPEFGVSKFSDADYSRTVRDINDLFFADDRFMFPSIAFHNFGWFRHVVPPEFGGQNFQMPITREPFFFFLQMIDSCTL